MNKHLRNLSRRYVATLRKYLTKQHETGLEHAYELGRTAIARELGLLNLVRIHQQATEPELWPAPNVQHRTRRLRAAASFFLEALSPFEIAQRGFCETNERLCQANAALATRNQELDRMNRGLKREAARRHQVEQALQQSESKFRAVVETARDGLMTADESGRIALMNASAEAMFGYSQAQVLGKSWTLFAPKEMRSEYRRQARQALRNSDGTRSGRTVEAVGRRKDGTLFPLEFSYSVWGTKGERTFTVIIRDITRRKLAAAALEQSEEHHRLLFFEAQAMQERLRDLSNRILHVQEEERKHISRELHDEVGQALTAVSVNLELLKRHGGARLETLKRKITAAQGQLQETMELVHRFARELRPAMLDDLGLLAALRSHLQRFAARTRLRVNFRGSALAEELGDDQKTVLFRVAQESLTNVAKHARARRVEVRLRKVRAGICLEVTDDGRSFQEQPQSSAKKNQRLGLLGMQERVRLVNGKFSVKPQPGRGTTIRVVLPFRGGDSRLRLKRVGVVRKALRNVFMLNGESSSLPPNGGPPFSNGWGDRLGETRI